MNPIANLKAPVRHLRKSLEAWRVIGDALGWKRAHKEGRPVDSEGHAIPWYTYPAIEFLRTLDMRNCRVFEYGCGNSSIFLAQRVKEIFAAENDPAWAKEVGQAMVRNLTIITVPEKTAYVNSPYSVGGKFDIMIVDGRYRRDCAEVAGQLINDDGFIIFDNADWYPAACASLRDRGWLQIDFSGLGPINPYAWTTAVFLRSSLGLQRNEGIKPIGGNPSGESKNG